MRDGRIDLCFCSALMSVCAIFMASGLSASSEEGKQPVLVELLTSEECSSCPPADALLAQLDRQQFIPGAWAIVLSEHVTYWNDLGWKDPFSKPELTEQQRRFANQLRTEGPYTPQMVVNGQWEFVGSNVAALSKAVQEAANQERLHPPVEIRVENLQVNGKTLHATIKTGPGLGALLFAVLAADTPPAQVARGENAGKSLSHVAVVRSLVELGAPLKDCALHLSLPGDTPAKMRLILFLQDGKTGRVMGSTEIIFNRSKAGA